MRPVDAESQRLVIVGGGFAGLNLARHLKRSPIQVTLLNETNYFNFQPLLYQVATGGLEPNSIAYPLRRMFRSAPNVSVRMARVERVAKEPLYEYEPSGDRREVST